VVGLVPLTKVADSPRTWAAEEIPRSAQVMLTVVDVFGTLGLAKNALSPRGQFSAGDLPL
jgi:hypothetical protein